MILDTEYPQFEIQDTLALSQLLKKINKNGIKILEIGSWTGTSTLTLAQWARKNNGRVQVVDTFQGSEGTRLKELAKNNKIYDLFIKNTKEYSDIIDIGVYSSIYMPYFLRYHKFDFIFIDGDHRYKEFKKDLENCYKRLNDGGILCGHDMDRRFEEIDFKIPDEAYEHDEYNHIHVGVSRALKEFGKEYNIVSKIWWMIK